MIDLLGLLDPLNFWGVANASDAYSQVPPVHDQVLVSDFPGVSDIQ